MVLYLGSRGANVVGSSDINFREKKEIRVGGGERERVPFFVHAKKKKKAPSMAQEPESSAMGALLVTLPVELVSVLLSSSMGVGAREEVGELPAVGAMEARFTQVVSLATGTGIPPLQPIDEPTTFVTTKVILSELVHAKPRAAWAVVNSFSVSSGALKHGTHWLAF